MNLFQNKKLTKYLRPLLAFILLILFWEIATRFFEVEPWILPSPLAIMDELFLVFHAFLPHVFSTVKLVIIGFTFGTILGLSTATILFHFPKIRETVYPFLIISQNIPIIVLAPLLFIWFGLGDLPKIMIIAMTSFFPITISTLSGYEQTDQSLLHYMEMMGASKSQQFTKLIFPYALPMIFSGIKISATYSMLTGVVAEWLGAQKGIGVYMTLASSSYQTARVFVAIIFTIILSLSFFALIVLIERFVLRWNRREI